MTRTPFADKDLARSLAADAREAGEWVRAASALAGLSPASLEVGGGTAVYVGPGSVLNGTSGLGFRGPVSSAQIVEIETFFAERGEAATIEVCPLADHSLTTELGRRGWVPDEFENVLYLALDEIGPEDGAPACGPDELWPVDLRVSTRVVEPDERALWADVMARGFAEGEPTAIERETATIVSGRDDLIYVLGLLDDEPAGTGQLGIRRHVAHFNSDSTLSRFRGRGIQSALLRARIWLAKAADCELAVIEAEPGSRSQRNMERLGFRVAWTNITFRKGGGA